MQLTNFFQRRPEYDEDNCLISLLPEVQLGKGYWYAGKGGEPNKDTIRAFDKELARYKQDHNGELPEEMKDDDGTPTQRHQKLINKYCEKVQRNMMLIADQMKKGKRFLLDANGKLIDPFDQPENTPEADEIVDKYKEYPLLGAKIANGMCRNINPRVSYNQTIERINWYARNYPTLFPGFLEQIKREDGVMLHINWADMRNESYEVLEAQGKRRWRAIRMQGDRIYLQVGKGNTTFDLNVRYQITKKIWDDSGRNFERILENAEQEYDDSSKKINAEKGSYR